jgi:hypothetical protein
LGELADGLLAATAMAGRGAVRATSVEISLPLEIRLPATDGELEGDLPLFRRRTAFDPEPARLTLLLAEVPA